MADSQKVSPEVAREHWSRSRNLMIVTLIVWAIFGYAIHYFVDQLNAIVILGFPMGWYMGAQGALIVFVILIFWFASRQNKIDEDLDLAEDTD